MLEPIRQRLRSADRPLAAFALVAFACWMASVGPVRTWATGAGVRDWWVFGVAPSAFAGMAIAAWQALAVRSQPALAVGIACGLVALAEVAHVWMPRRTADMWDVTAGVVGALLAWPVLRCRQGPPAQGRRSTPM